MCPTSVLILPPVVDLATAASLLNIGRTTAYELVRTGAWPTPVLRLGNRIRIPAAPLLQLVGIEPTEPVPDGNRDDPPVPRGGRAVHRPATLDASEDTSGLGSGKR